MERLLRPRHGGVDPLIGLLGGVQADVPGHMHIDLLPFPSLRLMAGDGISVDTPEGIEIGVVEHGIVERVGCTLCGYILLLWLSGYCLM